MMDVSQLPDDSPFYYLNLFNAPLEATKEDLVNLFPGLVIDAFPAGTSNRCWDLKFKDKMSLFQALKKEKFEILEREVFVRTSMKNCVRHAPRDKNLDRGHHREEYIKKDFKGPKKLIVRKGANFHKSQEKKHKEFNQKHNIV